MRRMTRNLATLVAILLVAIGMTGAPGTPAQAQEARNGARILVIGDSLLAWHSTSGLSVADQLQKILGEPVFDRSLSAARMNYALPITGGLGLSIPKQFKRSDTGYDWVIVDGGGNDLWLGCGCHRCERMLDRLVGSKGDRGKIPQLVARIRKTGARVIWLGYLRSPGFSTPIEDCKDEGDEMEARIARMAGFDQGVTFLSIADLVPPKDLSYHALDRIHPSPKASRAIAKRLAAIIRAGG